VLVENEPEHWYSVLSELVRRVTDLRHMAHEAARMSSVLGDGARTSAFWRRELALA
jgi:hypothetical protein